MSARTVTFYFDIISHNAYLAFEQLEQLAERHALNLALQPVVFGAILKHHGQLGPAEIAPKNLWMIRDVLRKASHLGVNINPPACHPFNPLLALRCLMTQPDDGARRAMTRTLFRAVWIDSKNVSDADELKEVLTRAGYDADSVLALAAAPDNKKALRAATEAAITASVFGVPSMSFDGQIYWGFDDLPVLEEVIANGDCIDDADLERWKQVPTGVVRSR